MKDVESLLAKYAREMDVLHEAASMGGKARYNVKFEEGFVAILPHAQELRTVCRMLCLESYVHAHQGDAHRAAESIHAGLLAAMSLENEPIPVSQVVCAAYIRLMTDTLQELLPNTDFSDKDLAMLQDTVRQYDARRSLRRGLAGVRALAIITFQEPAAADQFAKFDRRQKWLLSALGERTGDLTRYLELMDKVMAAVERPWPEAIASASAVSDEAELISEANLVDHLRYALTSSSFTAHDKFFESLAETEARLRVTDALLAAARHHKRHGRLPSQATDMVPEFLDEIPQDSFSEGPLRLVFDEDRFTVYSMGSNLRDDGGSNDPAVDQELDIVMRLIP